MTLFEELKEKVHSKTDSNFHLKCLDLTTQVWIQELCELIDGKLVDEDKKVKQPDTRKVCHICGGVNYNHRPMCSAGYISK